ncbi:MAG TPA: histidinol dehydrogenase [Candidatus Thermoplasmatota archaeon]|nr:histidinol dehydrogenase [Candidatus Thermoplasmatota archaeon]
MLRPQSLTEADWTRFTQRAQAVDPGVEQAAAAILAEVRAGGDDALRACTRRFDKADLADPFLPKAEWKAAARTVPADLRRALRENHRRIRAFHALQAGREQRLDTAPGLRLGRRPIPLDVVACYVPGGRASYPSTVLMTATLAKLAGVRRIVVATPPRPDGSIDPAVLAAAKIAGATEVLRAGGAQAIAALAFGTRSVAPVQAIVGPGNAYVTAAKAQVAHLVRTDAPAGPSELLVVADATAKPAEIALDLLAQAEHDPDAQVLLVATSRKIAEAVAAELESRVPRQERSEVIAASLRDHGALLVARDLAEALRFSDAYAPEHLTLMVKNPRAVLAKVHNAGSVFLGRHTPVSLGDYGSGTNHVLPTMGHAARRGGLCVDDFRKWLTWQEATPAGLRAVAGDVVRVARAEGLHAHAEAVEQRIVPPQRTTDPTERTEPPIRAIRGIRGSAEGGKQ